jgi:hypothetical protein
MNLRVRGLLQIEAFWLTVEGDMNKLSFLIK